MPDQYAIAAAFIVKIDNNELGAFSSCDGLGCEMVMEQREEGGNFGHVWQLPTRLKFSNVKLSRPVSAESAKVTQWFADMASGVRRSTATIEARTLRGEVIARWNLLGVVPVRWTGPQLTPDSQKPAMETLELAHHGFLAPGSGAGR
jgi:phage tail-like protein